MEVVFNFLSANPFLMGALIIVILILVILIMVGYVAAFAQGREVSFWPPKIGPKIEEQTKKNKRAFLTSAFQFRRRSGKNDQEAPIHFYVKKPAEFHDYLSSAKEVWLLGVILLNTTKDNMPLFAKKLESGGCIRALISNPDQISHEEITSRFSPPNTSLKTVGQNYVSVKNWYRNLRNGADNPTSVELRLLDFVPPYSLYVFPEISKESLFVEIYGYQTGIGSIPRFMILKEENPYWYKHFFSQFEVMWKSATRLNY